MASDDPDPSADAQLVSADEAAILRSLGAMSPFELAAARYRDGQSDDGDFDSLIGSVRYDRRGLLMTLKAALAEISKLRTARDDCDDALMLVERAYDRDVPSRG